MRIVNYLISFSPNERWMDSAVKIDEAYIGLSLAYNRLFEKLR